MNAISRGTAHGLGLKRFYTGEPCKRGHLSERWVAGGGCIQCKQENWDRWAARNPEDYAQQRRDGYLRNKETIRVRKLAWMAANPEKVEANRVEAIEKRRAAKASALLELNLKRASAGLHPVTKRSVAMAAGEAHYYTGKPCKRGHIEVPRATNTGVCVECNRERAREFYAKNPEKAREWQRNNPDKVAQYTRKWAAKNPDKVAGYARKSYAKNPEKRRINSTAYAQRNREKIAAKARAKYVEKCRSEGRVPRKYRRRTG